MTKLLIFIGEGRKFDIESPISAINSMQGCSHARRGDFIGAIFECEYSYGGLSTIVRISPDAETITADGLGDDALSFALELQRALGEGLSVIDLEYSFNLPLGSFKSLLELKKAISA